MHGATIVIMIMQLWYDPNQQPLRKKKLQQFKNVQDLCTSRNNLFFVLQMLGLSDY